MTTSLILASFLLLTLVARPLHTKTMEVREDKAPIFTFLLKKGFLTQIKDNFQNKMHMTDIKRILSSGGAETLKSFMMKLSKMEALQALVNDSIIQNKDIINPFLKLATKMRKMKNESNTSQGGINDILEILYNNLIPQDMQTKLEEEETEHSPADFQNKLIETAANVFDGKLNNLDSALVSTTPHSFTEMSSLNSTYSSIWMIVKSTWQRLLAYVEDENSLETFMQLTPVRIMDSIISLGDDLNLMNFLAKKLDKDLAEFVAGEINPYLGPLKDFDTFYNFTKENGFNGIIDYFTSERFTYTINAMSKFISAYLEDTVSDDLVNQYIEFISFNNTELLNFYKSVLRSQGKTFSLDNTSDTSGKNITQRFKRDVLEDIASSFISNLGSEDNMKAESGTISPRQLQQRFGAINSLGLTNSLYDPSRDGGYGGGGGGGGGYGYGGYGGGHGGYSMNTLDPYVILGSLALGTILGFLLFRALRGTGGGRRDIGDGSLSLWDSDLPDQVLPWGSNVQRKKRDVHDDTQGFSLPPSLRGDVWSSDPLVADNLLDDHLHEDDTAHHLNHLWRLYRDTNETACVHSHLCDVMASTTAQQLTGKHSGLALLMASLSNMLGVVGSGQLVDDVTHSLVVGSPYSCPNIASCHLI